MSSVYGDCVAASKAEVFYNKTIIDCSNTVAASYLKTNEKGVLVQVNNSAPPNVGDVLVATSSTNAIWQAGGGGGGIFSNFEQYEQLIPVNTTIFYPNFASMLSYATAVKPAGNYVVYWEYDYTVDAPAVDLMVKVSVDGTIYAMLRTGIESSTTGADTDPFAITGSGNNQRHHTSGWFPVVFGVDAAHNIDIDFCKSINLGTQSVSLADSRIMIWKTP